MNGRGVGDPERLVTVGPQATPDPVAPGQPAVAAPGPESGARNRRSAERFDVQWSVDCATEETFLFAAITNVSAMGIFVSTLEPLPVGTLVTLRFAPAHAEEPFVLTGTVQWVNIASPLENTPNPGMGVRFSSLSPEERERLVEVIHTIAYLREEPWPRAVPGAGD
jgi:type IV pilus assembly protein PilZ